MRDFQNDHQGDADTQRCIPGQSFAQPLDVDIQHHHHEQEQHHDRADIDQHQDDRQKFRLQQHPQHGAADERQHQEHH